MRDGDAAEVVLANHRGKLVYIEFRVVELRAGDKQRSSFKHFPVEVGVGKGHAVRSE